jgi:hypothetical protein
LLDGLRLAHGIATAPEPRRYLHFRSTVPLRLILGVLFFYRFRVSREFTRGDGIQTSSADENETSSLNVL